MIESLKERIDTVIAYIRRRLDAGQPISSETLAELRRLTAVAWEQGFEAGRDGALRPPNPLAADLGRPWAPRVWRCPRCNATIGTTSERESEAVAEHALTCAGKLELIP